MKVRFVQFILVAFSSALIGYGIGVTKIGIDWKLYSPKIEITSKEPPPSVSNIDLSHMWISLQKLQSSYYDKTLLDPQKLVNGAISGMVSSLGDPYTVYLPAKQNNDFKEGMAGQFEGIGAELGMKDKFIIVVAPIDGMPAQKAGIRAGDAIIKVDDKAIDGLTLAQTVEKIRGPKGTTVKLSILHENEKKLSDITVTRGTITVKSVAGGIKKLSDMKGVSLKNLEEKDAKNKESKKEETGAPMLGTKDKQVIYVKLSQFGDHTNEEWTTLVNEVVVQMQNNKDKVKGLVLDVRNNPGGYLTDAQFIASEFIKEGTIVVQDPGVGNGEKTILAVNKKGLLLDIPMVVLINKGSASASEIVSGALRDHKRAKLIGEVSFGKGTIQTAEDLGGGAGIHITIAKWLTPNGTWVHGKGLIPDITVLLDEKDPNHDTQLEKAVEELIK